MSPLRAAAQGAIDFESWAIEQGCDTSLLTDQGGSRITVSNIYNAVNRVVDSQIYDQLIVYFSGHGILAAPGTEYWLLSGAPENPNEAVSLARTIEDARWSSIPHIVFVSDACRSSANCYKLRGIIGGAVFPMRLTAGRPSEVDTFYATRPGHPAFELPENESVSSHSGVFTKEILSAVRDKAKTISVTHVMNGSRERVVTSRALKTYLEKAVPDQVEEFDFKLSQYPEIRVETVLPQYFALLNENNDPLQSEQTAPSSSPVSGMLAPDHAIPIDSYYERTLIDLAMGNETIGNNNSKIGSESHVHHRSDTSLLAEADEIFRISVESILNAPNLSSPHGNIEVIGSSVTDATSTDFQLRIFRSTRYSHVSIETPPGIPYRKLNKNIVLEFENEIGTIIPYIKGYNILVQIKDGEIVAINYTPSYYSSKYSKYLDNMNESEQIKALAAVSSRHGSFFTSRSTAKALSLSIRQFRGVDPVLGIYAAYAYSGAGLSSQIENVFRLMIKDPHIVPFDVAMLAFRRAASRQLSNHNPVLNRVASEVPMLTQGWGLLRPGDPLHQELHEDLRPHLIPSLWVTLTPEGVGVARSVLKSNTYHG